MMTSFGTALLVVDAHFLCGAGGAGDVPAGTRYKSIIGDGLRSRSPAGQGSEVVLGCEILNRMTALGRPASYRIGR